MEGMWGYKYRWDGIFFLIFGDMDCFHIPGYKNETKQWFGTWGKGNMLGWAYEIRNLLPSPYPTIKHGLNVYFGYIPIYIWATFILWDKEGCWWGLVALSLHCHQFSKFLAWLGHIVWTSSMTSFVYATMLWENGYLPPWD